MNLAVKLPSSLRERVLTFPFLQILVRNLKERLASSNKDLPEEEHESLSVHLLVEKENLDVLNLLPIQAYYHEFEPEDLKTVFTAHRACKNLKLENVDVYISATENFVDASIGKNLGATTRVGFALGKNALMLNRKISLLKGRHISDQYLELARPFVENWPEELPKAFSRELDPYYQDWRESPYYLVNLGVKDDKVEEFWTELFSLVEGENLVLFCEGLSKDDQNEILKPYIKGLGPKNTYKIFEGQGNIEFAKAAAYAQSFVSADSPLVHVAAYCGGGAHYLVHKEDVQKTGPLPFIGEVRYFNLKEPIFRESGEIAYHKVWDEVVKFMELKKKERSDC